MKFIGRGRGDVEEKPEKPEQVPVPSAKWIDFLTSMPPLTMTEIEDLTHGPISTGGYVDLQGPEIILHCSSEVCQGDRVFVLEGSPPSIFVRRWDREFLNFACRNCRQSRKVFAILTYAHGTGGGRAVKLGEWPPFGPPTPARLITLIGPDRELFLKGRRAENNGLGIGAFSYYRRVVENQKNRLLDEIIRVSRRLGAKPEKIALLEKAKVETQFSNAVEMVKDAIPESLLVQGHNPFTLLYKALSEGLHAESDEGCLEAASAIRVVLAELSERIGQVLKDDAELKEAISRLLRDKKPPPEG